MKKLLIPILIILVCCSCGSTKVVQPVRDVHKDTIYINSFQQDSIYIFKDRLIDRSRDTLFIKDKSVEYRYKLLRDTVRIVQRDSIPYEVTITEVKEITLPLSLFDYICRYSFFFLLGIIIYLLYNKFKSINLKL